MHETREDLAALQELIDRSYAEAGAHLLRIHSPERRLTAEQLSERLQGVVLLRRWRRSPPTAARSTRASSPSGCFTFHM